MAAPPAENTSVDSVESLHEAGWTTLSARPKWEALDMCEQYHQQFAEHVIDLLKAREDRWMEIGSSMSRVGSAVMMNYVMMMMMMMRLYDALVRYQ